MGVERIIRHHLGVLRRNKAPAKEKKRLKDVYRTVYAHAKKKGQSHRQALSYCFNVYSMRAPEKYQKIIKTEQDLAMSTKKTGIREIIRYELSNLAEGDVVDFSSSKQQAAPAAPITADSAVDAAQEYNTFLSEIHNQIIEFMEDNFESLDVEQQGFLDEILDSIEENLGMEDEAGLDVSSLEDEGEEDL